MKGESQSKSSVVNDFRNVFKQLIVRGAEERVREAWVVVEVVESERARKESVLKTET